ncbi:SRPBCC domain-containing protein [Microbacterium sp. ET2]|uniref:SRPBCC family protein n=1 Tax=Microbacterium albipurpureum TaxID=3050384 RepID=UPI00259CCFD6|nr:SRPBCC domain-containing protein [Microbacterium sp. ET2 (Ac-2212)]WJL94878.1 SRPBCC domain-containing protein [Microbacterium sp. ET2 (Ac-2212)]
MTDTRELRLNRLIHAPLDQVWTAWTTPAGLRTWWWNHWPETQISADAVVGGRYRFAAPQVGIVVSGEYLTVDEPHRLSFTWRWEDADGVQDGEIVDVTFVTVAQGTRVTIVHRGPWQGASAAEDYRQGWTFVLDALAAHTADASRPGNQSVAGP